MIVNAVSYARFSSNNQREASIEIQQEHIHKYCKDNGITIIKDYVDRAVSATSDNRPQFQQMIKDSESGLFSYVIVYNTSRFCRNIQDHLKYRAILETNGVKIISVNENFDDSTPEGDLMTNFMMSINQYYSKDLGRKTYLGCMETAKNGKNVGGRTLYGYDIVDQMFVINEAEADVVRLIFDLTAQGYSNSEICEELNKRNIVNRAGKPFQAKFSNMLRNRKYIGEFIWNQYKRNKITGKVIAKDASEVVRIPNGIPKIVDELTFEKVQKILNERNRHKVRKKKSPYLLNGLVKCGECGYSMCVDYNRNANGRGNYVREDYRCYSKSRRRATCDLKPIKIQYLDTYILNLVKSVFLNERYNKKITKLIAQLIDDEYELKNKVLDQKEKELILNKEEIRKLIDSLPEAKSVVYIEIINAIEKLKIKQNDIVNQIELIKKEQIEYPVFSEKTTLEQIHKMKSSVKDMHIENIKELINDLLSKVEIYNDKVIVKVNMNCYLSRKYCKQLEISIIEDIEKIKNKENQLEQNLNWSSLKFLRKE